MAKGRGRKSNIELLPQECSHIVIWAAEQLQANDRTQLDIYQEFVPKLEEILRESRGELEFAIPSFSAFNRHSIKLDAYTRDMNETRQMASAIAGTYDAEESDDLTLIAAEAIKALIFQMMTAGKKQIDPKAVNELSSALHKATQAQNVSTARRQKVEKEFSAKASEAVKTVAKAKGLSADTAQEILSQILGVKTG